MDYLNLLGRLESELGDQEPITMSVADLTVKLIAGGTMPGLTGTRDPDAVIDGILLGTALVMEQAPEHPNAGALRRGAKAFADRLHEHARLARAMFEQTGEHPMLSVLSCNGKTPTVLN
ncbi:MAG: hypothetical protein EOO76_03005 [Novosphingobium sp.]|nr:MAG: hypothetical protein EOO76_03005 [Novosphingobium sp.]